MNKYCPCSVSSGIQLKCSCSKAKLDFRIFGVREGRREQGARYIKAGFAQIL